MSYREPFAPGEWYHCYSRGVEKREVFESEKDYERFVEGLYLCNDVEPLHRHILRRRSHNELLLERRNKELVSIGAYCLMPNHFHILLKEIEGGGITKFMRKLGTAYTMYFNTKEERVGNLFVKPFRSKHVGDDLYFKQVTKYIHLNPAELFESGWKNGRVKNLPVLKKKLEGYPYSSFPDYCEIDRVEAVVLDKKSFNLLRDISISKNLIAEAAAYYTSLPR